MVWATYEGGPILSGTLKGHIKDGKLIITYRHQNTKGESLTGRCESTPEMKDGIIRLNEKWQWTCKDYSKGESVIEEIPAPTK